MSIIEVGRTPGVAALLLALREEDALLALQQLQSHVGSSQVAAHADEVGVLGSGAAHYVVAVGQSGDGDADGEPGERRGGVAAHYVYVVLVARQPDALVELLDVFNAEAPADAQAQGHLCGRGVHGVDVGDVDHGCLVAQVLQRHVGEVEVYALEQEVGADERLLLAGVYHGAVVAYALHGGGVERLYVFGEPVNETELSECGYFCTCHIL
jgi:hypothetical protein